MAPVRWVALIQEKIKQPLAEELLFRKLKMAARFKVASEGQCPDVRKYGSRAQPKKQRSSSQEKGPTQQGSSDYPIGLTIRKNKKRPWLIPRRFFCRFRLANLIPKVPSLLLSIPQGSRWDRLIRKFGLIGADFRPATAGSEAVCRNAS